MKISELVERLNKIKEVFGDLLIEKDANENFCVSDLSVINEFGYETNSTTDAYSVFIE